MAQFSMVQDIKRVLHSLRLQPPVTILGHSVGGRIGMTMALNDGISWVKDLIVVDECPSMNPVLQKESTTPLYINLLKSINPNRYGSLQEIDGALAAKITVYDYKLNTKS